MTWLFILKFPHFGLQIYILKIFWFSVYKNCGSDGLCRTRTDRGRLSPPPAVCSTLDSWGPPPGWGREPPGHREGWTRDKQRLWRQPPSAPPQVWSPPARGSRRRHSDDNIYFLSGERKTYSHLSFVNFLVSFTVTDLITQVTFYQAFRITTEEASHRHNELFSRTLVYLFTVDQRKINTLFCMNISPSLSPFSLSAVVGVACAAMYS